jgi:hypothetical protein
MKNIYVDLDSDLYEEAEIAWYETGVYLEAMYDYSIDKDEWIETWVEEHAKFSD